MLATLTKIGEQLLEGQGIWSRLTIEPKTTEGKNQWVCPILFDCDLQEIRFLELTRYHSSNEIGSVPSSVALRYVNPDLWGRRGKKCALTVENKNFSMLPETFFGKGKEGSPMLRSLEGFDQELKNSEIYHAIEVISSTFNNQQERLNLQNIKEQFNLRNDDEIVLFYSLIQSKGICNGDQTMLKDLNGYEDFFVGKFGTPEGLTKGLDYVKGIIQEHTIEANFTGRYNIHKIFQTTTSNYATGFSDFSKNFRSSPETLAALNKASDYILNKKMWKPYVAGIPHIVIPSVLNRQLDQLKIKELEDFVVTSSELLFQNTQVENLADELEFLRFQTFWINYVAFESDGNSFKVINHIKDINSQYLINLIKVFKETEIHFLSYRSSRYNFNLQTIYGMVPVREQKGKKNQALSLFKDILEQHTLEISILYKHFIQLVRCHWGGQFNEKRRHRTFPNIRQETSFDFAAKNAVYNYMALIKALTSINLIQMEENQNDPTVDKLRRKYPNRDVDEFWSLKQCDRNTIALFCLGRMVNVIGYAQEMKGHKTRPILNKLNFNRMGLDDIINLTTALMDKGNQYQEVKRKEGKPYQARKRVEEYADLFHKYLDHNKWDVDDNKAVFYILAGYVFRSSSGKHSNSSEQSSNASDSLND